MMNGPNTFDNSCFLGKFCEILVTGEELQDTNKIRMVHEDSTCGAEEMDLHFGVNWDPVPTLTIGEIILERFGENVTTTLHTFAFGQAMENVGNYKMCWGQNPGIAKNLFNVRIGSMNIAGPQQRDIVCVAGRKCFVELEGVGFDADNYGLLVEGPPTGRPEDTTCDLDLVDSMGLKKTQNALTYEGLTNPQKSSGVTYFNGVEEDKRHIIEFGIPVFGDLTEYQNEFHTGRQEGQMFDPSPFFRMCWSYRNDPAISIYVVVGTMKLTGARHKEGCRACVYQTNDADGCRDGDECNFTCIMGEPCHLSVEGSELVPANGIAICQSECGQKCVFGNFTGITNPMKSLLIIDGMTEDTYEMGTARWKNSLDENLKVCWSETYNQNAAVGSDYAARVGNLVMTGPAPGNTTCYIGNECHIRLSGAGFSTLQRIRFVKYRDHTTDCREEAVEWSEHQYRNNMGYVSSDQLAPPIDGVSSSEMRFDLGTSLAPNARGSYLLCWHHGPSSSADFSVYFGWFGTCGPDVTHVHGQHTTCTLGRPCNIVMTGVCFSEKNSIIMVNKTTGCGASARKVDMYGVASTALNPSGDLKNHYSTEVGESNTATYALGNISQRGDWETEYTICWGELPDMTKSPDTYLSDHLVDYGELLVVGPHQNDYTCHVGLKCEVLITGKYLNKSQYISVFKGTTAEDCLQADNNVTGWNQHDVHGPYSLPYDGRDAMIVNLGIPTYGAPGKEYVVCWGTTADNTNVLAGTIDLSGPIYSDLNIMFGMTLNVTTAVELKGIFDESVLDNSHVKVMLVEKSCDEEMDTDEKAGIEIIHRPRLNWDPAPAIIANIGKGATNLTKEWKYVWVGLFRMVGVFKLCWSSSEDGVYVNAGRLRSVGPVSDQSYVDQSTDVPFSISLSGRFEWQSAADESMRSQISLARNPCSDLEQPRAYYYADPTYSSESEIQTFTDITATEAGAFYVCWHSIVGAFPLELGFMMVAGPLKNQYAEKLARIPFAVNVTGELVDSGWQMVIRRMACRNPATTAPEPIGTAYLTTNYNSTQAEFGGETMIIKEPGMHVLCYSQYKESEGFAPLDTFKTEAMVIQIVGPDPNQNFNGTALTPVSFRLDGHLLKNSSNLFFGRDCNRFPEPLAPGEKRDHGDPFTSDFWATDDGKFIHVENLLLPEIGDWKICFSLGTQSGDDVIEAGTVHTKGPLALQQFYGSIRADFKVGVRGENLNQTLNGIKLVPRHENDCSDLTATDYAGDVRILHPVEAESSNTSTIYRIKEFLYWPGQYRVCWTSDVQVYGINGYWVDAGTVHIAGPHVNKTSTSIPKKPPYMEVEVDSAFMLSIDGYFPQSADGVVDSGATSRIRIGDTTCGFSGSQRMSDQVSVVSSPGGKRTFGTELVSVWSGVSLQSVGEWYVCYCAGMEPDDSRCENYQNYVVLAVLVNATAATASAPVPLSALFWPDFGGISVTWASSIEFCGNPEAVRVDCNQIFHEMTLNLFGSTDNVPISCEIHGESRSTRVKFATSPTIENEKIVIIAGTICRKGSQVPAKVAYRPVGIPANAILDPLAISFELKKNLANKIFWYLARCGEIFCI